jgi:hypothetical protein
VLGLYNIGWLRLGRLTEDRRFTEATQSTETSKQEGLEMTVPDPLAVDKMQRTESC